MTDSAGPGGSTIRDELNEVIVLKDVRLLIGEYIPFGVNHIVAFNDKLGSYMRVKSALLTQVVDDDPGGMQFSIPPVMTAVQVKDFDRNNFVEFEAQIHYPEPPGIVQVENFGVHVSSAGKVLYGLELESVAGRPKAHVSLDHLSRVLADVVQDSSQMMDTLLTDYQRTLLDLTFVGKAASRDKYAFLLAGGITPDVASKEYVDGEERENELRQLLETFQTVHDLPDGSKMLIGTHGSILVAKDPRKYELVAGEYSFLMSMDIFIQNFFARIFMLTDSAKDIRRLIDSSEEDPNAVERAQSMLSGATSNAVLLGEILGYLRESATALSAEWTAVAATLDPAVRDAAGHLTIEARVAAIQDQVRDMDHLIDGLLKSLEGLSRMNETINQRQMRHFQETLEENSRTLEDITRSGERTSAGVEVMEMILSGTLAFELVSLFSGGNQFPFPVDSGPTAVAWAGISVGAWVAGSVALFLVMKWLGDQAEPALVVRLKINRKFNAKRLAKFLSGREVTTQDIDLYGQLARKKIMWKYNDGVMWEVLPKWGKRKVIIHLTCDENTGYLLNALIEVQRPGEMTLAEVRQAFLDEINEEKVV